MMDFSYYPNIAALADMLGGEKRTSFNKKKHIKAEESWKRLGPDELSYINAAAPTAVRILDCYVTPYYILHMDMRAFFVRPVRDLVWMYTSVLTNRMNFIPYNKTHNLFIVDREGELHTLGTKSTGGFSKKTPCDDAMRQMLQIIAPQRKGLLIGWSDQLSTAVRSNLASVVQSVDANSAQ